MGIKFQSNHPNDSSTVHISGDVGDTVADGGVGPFPKYSISREDNFSGDGTYLSSKFTININGYATIQSQNSSGALIEGQRGSAVSGEKIVKLQFNKKKWPMIGTGKLTIEPVTGSNKLVFNDASLVSVDIPEDEEQSSGIHYTAYGMVFEAYNFENTTMPTQMVSSVDESWEITQNEGQYAYAGNDISTTPQKVYTLTHSLSAVGIKRYTNTSLDDDGDDWRQAAKWIDTRIQSNIDNDTKIDSHINSSATGPKFQPMKMTSDNLSGLIADFSGYQTYNHTRQGSVDISGGGYNLTETWTLAPAGLKALHEISVDVDISQESENSTVTVNGTVIGLDTRMDTGDLQKSELYFNAESELESVLGYAFTLADNDYKSLNKTLYEPSTFSVVRALNVTPIKKSVAHNKATGQISWSLSYNDEGFLAIDPLKSKLISEEVSVSYTNQSRSESLIAIIPVIGKSEGPVIQSFTGNKERSMSLSVNLVFKAEHNGVTYRGMNFVGSHLATRNELASYIEGLIKKYASVNTWYVSSRSESWDKNTGAYGAEMTIIYI